MVQVDRAVMVPGVPRRVDELERAATERETFAVLDDQHPLRRDRQQLAVELVVPRFPVDPDRAGDEPGRIDKVRGTAGVQHGPGVRQGADHLPGTAGMVEVHMGEKQEVDLLAGNAEFVQGGEQPGGCRGGPGVHERRATVLDDQVTRRQSGAHVQGVDQEYAAAQGLRQGGVRAGVGARGHAGPGSLRGWAF
jgi:hypothetical protein